MTYKTGSVREFMQWTKRVVTDPATADDTPKRWFDSDATASKAIGTTTSPEAMVKLLSPENLALLRTLPTGATGSLGFSQFSDYAAAVAAS